jgi:hypothetical protein
VSPQEIAAILRRHLIAIAIVALAACMLSYHLIYANPGYIDSGNVGFIAPKNPISMFVDTRSLQVTEEAAAWFIMGPQGQRQVRAAGGTVPYDVAMLNSYNEEYPNYNQPYVTIAVMSHYPEEAEQTFRAVLGVLSKATLMLQERAGANPKNEVRAKLVAQPTGPVAQSGSHKRSYAALAVLAMIAIYMIARALDRRRPRRQPRHRGNPRHRILLGVFDR